MKQTLRKRLAVVALVLVIASLLAGVAVAATSASPASQGTSKLAEIVAIDLQVEVNGRLEVAGAGFQAGELVTLQIVVGGGVPEVPLANGEANDAGAFVVDATSNFPSGGLPDAVVAGVYTIQALTGEGHVASAPLIVSEPKVE